MGLRTVFGGQSPLRFPARAGWGEGMGRGVAENRSKTYRNQITLGFLIHGFWAGRESSISGVWAASAAPKTIPKGGGVAAGAAQTPKINDLRPAQKPCITNPSVDSIRIRSEISLGPD